MVWRNLLPPSPPPHFRLKVETVHPQKPVVAIYQTIWHHMPEDSIFIVTVMRTSNLAVYSLLQNVQDTFLPHQSSPTEATKAVQSICILKLTEETPNRLDWW